jgi:ABC-type uncharacterized transport system substrate-binding protein
MKNFLLLLILCSLGWTKILLVNSYSPKDHAVLQLNGFLYEMYKNNYSPQDFKICFLDARVTSVKDLRKKAKKILKNIKNYSYIVTFDDAAFKLIGIPASKKGKIVIFSGMNYPYKKYKKQYHLADNIGGVFEKLYIEESLEVYNKIIPVNKVALFYSDGIGEVAKDQILNEVKNTPFAKKIVPVHVKTLAGLKNKTRQINKDPQFTVFIPMAFNVTYKNRKIPFYKLKNIFLDNIKKPDLSPNITFIKLGFIGFGGVDFYEMGKSTADILLNYIKTKKLYIINAPKMCFFINAKRAKEIHLKLPEWFIKNYVKDIIW